MVHPMMKMMMTGINYQFIKSHNKDNLMIKGITEELKVETEEIITELVIKMFSKKNSTK